MALSHKARRRWALFILLFGLPVYIAAAWYLTSLFERPGLLLELAIYVALGVVWALPFRAVFRGVGQMDPERGPAATAPPEAAPSAPDPATASSDAKKAE